MSESEVNVKGLAKGLAISGKGGNASPFSEKANSSSKEAIGDKFKISTLLQRKKKVERRERHIWSSFHFSVVCSFSNILISIV